MHSPTRSAPRAAWTRALRHGVVLLAPLWAASSAAAQSLPWFVQLGTSNQEEARACSPDGSGGLFVCGWTSGDLGGPSAGKRDAWIARLDGAGTVLWTRQLGSSEDDYATAVSADQAGGFFVGGWTAGSLGGPFSGPFDSWLARYDGAGNQLWIKQSNQTPLGLRLHGLAADGAGGVLVGGEVEAGFGTDGYVARLDGSGNGIWYTQFGGPVSTTRALAVTPDGAGGAFACGGTDANLGGPWMGGASDNWFARFDGAGTLSWLVQTGLSWNDSALALATDGSGFLYVGGGTGGSSYYNKAWLMRYNAAGPQPWYTELSAPGDQANGARGIALDGSGGAYVCGTTGGSLGGSSAGGNDVWFARYDAGGNQLWKSQLGTSGDDRVFGLVAGPPGQLLMCGSTTGNLGGTNAGQSDAWVGQLPEPCGSAVTYCNASTTSIPGCVPAIAAGGLASLSNPGGFTISSGNVPGGNLGILFFGTKGPGSLPFGTSGGRICVGPPVTRVLPKASGGSSGQCNGVFAFTLQDLLNALPLQPSGPSVHAQIWARDFGSPDGFLLSDGLAFTLCP